ncbi:hypothetical protein B0J14DRAFT_239914 [Halenospora varia]|nr:hypothetical protein B0J14DRAFT_239914 [Halenospora varia]
MNKGLWTIVLLNVSSYVGDGLPSVPCSRPSDPHNSCHISTRSKNGKIVNSRRSPRIILGPDFRIVGSVSRRLSLKIWEIVKM